MQLNRICRVEMNMLENGSHEKKPAAAAWSALYQRCPSVSGKCTAQGINHLPGGKNKKGTCKKKYREKVAPASRQLVGGCPAVDANHRCHAVQDRIGRRSCRRAGRDQLVLRNVLRVVLAHEVTKATGRHASAAA